MNIQKQRSKFVQKPWGYEEILVNDQKYCGKVLYIHRGSHTSWHWHILKDETFFILEGILTVIYSTEDCIVDGKIDNQHYAEDFGRLRTETLFPGDKLDMPHGMRHRLIGIQNTKIIEVSTHFDDNDTIRVLV